MLLSWHTARLALGKLTPCLEELESMVCQKKVGYVLGFVVLLIAARGRMHSRKHTEYKRSQQTNVVKSAH